MASEKLYALAAQLRTYRPWDIFSEDEFFAVRLAKDRIGYCCILGEMNDYLALALYPGETEFDTLRRVGQSVEQPSGISRDELLLSQDCIQCSFENRDGLSPAELAEAHAMGKKLGIAYRGRKSFPQFLRFSPYRLPWPLRKSEEEGWLVLALEAALEILRQTDYESKWAKGFNGGAPFRRQVPFLEKQGSVWNWGSLPLPDLAEEVYPAPRLVNDLTAARLKRLPHDGTWLCDVLLTPDPMQEAEDEAPVFPFTALLGNVESGTVYPTLPVMDYHSEAAELLENLANNLLEYEFVPAVIQVASVRAEAFLSAFCRQADIQLERKETLPALEDMKAQLRDELESPEENREFHQMCDLIFAMEPEELRAMPEAIQEDLKQLAEDGILPPHLAQKLHQALDD